MARWTRGEAEVEALVAAGELQQLTGEAANGQRLLQKAAVTLETARTAVDRDADSAFVLAYDAARQGPGSNQMTRAFIRPSAVQIVKDRVAGDTIAVSACDFCATNVPNRPQPRPHRQSAGEAVAVGTPEAREPYDRPTRACGGSLKPGADGALFAIRNAGLFVPDDISLVGYNDIPIISRLPTPLTTVRVPFDQVARAALDLLLAESPGSPGQVRVAAPTLIPRRSTAAPADLRPHRAN
jgi:hypothetical protein